LVLSVKEFRSGHTGQELLTEADSLKQNLDFVEAEVIAKPVYTLKETEGGQIDQQLGALKCIRF
jgi:hypothetical protein